MSGIFKRKARDRDYLVVDDQTGFTRWASDTVKQYDGLRVNRKSLDHRHPQEMTTGRPDRQTVPDARPPGVTRITGPLKMVVTAAAAAGATQVYVDSTARVELNDRVNVPCGGGSIFQTRVQTINSDNLVLTGRLPGAVEVGAEIVDVSAMAQPELE